MLTMYIIIFMFLVAFILFCNGAVVWAVDERKENNFFLKWKAELEEEQDIWVGRYLMASFYFVPTMLALISWLSSRVRAGHTETL